MAEGRRHDGYLAVSGACMVRNNIRKVDDPELSVNVEYPLSNIPQYSVPPPRVNNKIKGPSKENTTTNISETQQGMWGVMCIYSIINQIRHNII